MIIKEFIQIRRDKCTKLFEEQGRTNSIFQCNGILSQRYMFSTPLVPVHKSDDTAEIFDGIILFFHNKELCTIKLSTELLELQEDTIFNLSVLYNEKMLDTLIFIALHQQDKYNQIYNTLYSTEHINLFFRGDTQC